MDYSPLKTERLQLRTITLADTPYVLAHFSNPDVMRYITDTEPCKKPIDAEAIITFHKNSTGCRYGVFLEPARQFIGTCGYHCWDPSPSASSAEIGYDLSPDYWGQGYMREAVSALIQFGFDQMKLDSVIATAAAQNTRSRHLLECLSFVETHTCENGDIAYRLSRGEWQL